MCGAVGCGGRPTFGKTPAVNRLPALVLLVLVGCPNPNYTRLYHTEPKAPSLSQEDIEAMKTLGPTLIDQGINFSVYSEAAERIEVLLFDDPESNLPTRQFPLQRFGDVWNLYVEGVGLGQHYGYIAWGSNWHYDPDWRPGTIKGFVADVDAAGARFNPNKLLFDPYGKALHRDHDWSKGSIASGPKRTEVTYGAAAKTVVVKSAYEWSANEAQFRTSRQDPNWVGHRPNDLILYEVHAKGFTASPASGVMYPGTYRGLAEKADYFKDLGITAIELMPIHEKPLDGGYWGYQTLSFFAPELSFASRRQNAEVIDEFKAMVDALHQRGIEVIVDVVFNHTGEGGFWRNKLEFDLTPDPAADEALLNFDAKEVTGLYSYRGLDNHAYYALVPDDPGFYWNDTGVGNQMRANHRPMRKLIVDSLRYYVEEFHVDGFRFDLAAALGVKDLDYKGWVATDSVLQDIVDDPVLQKYNTRLIAEPWSAGGTQVGGFPVSTSRPGYGFGEWNGSFRDFWRRAINEGAPMSYGAGQALTGSSDFYRWNGRKPYHSINFATCHDGFTMYDLFSYAMKQNKCGPLNPVCCDNPFSSFCDRDSGESNNHSRDWGQNAEAVKRQMMRNLFVAMLIAHGTPMLYGGDEWLRTQLGNNNAYSTSADNEYNWFDWGVWESKDDRHRMHDFVRQLVRFRKEHAYAFAPTEYDPVAFAWKTPQNTDMNDAAWARRALMQHYYDGTKGKELAILINMEDGAVDFTLPTGRSWARVIDTQQYFDDPATLTSLGIALKASGNITLAQPMAVPGPTYGVQSRSIVVLEAQ